MSAKAPPRPALPEAALARARTAFEAGRISLCWQEIAPLLAQDTPPEVARALEYLQLGCALYHIGDLEAARALNARLPVAQWTTMRYRLSLRLRDPAMAKRLRGAPGLSPRDRDDFRTSAGLYCLWHKRPRAGLPLYAARHNAVHFPKLLPAGVAHQPLGAPQDDTDLIVLEQGLGDVLFHLAHIRACGGHEGSTFTGLPKYGALVRRYFPKARFLAAGDLPEGPRPGHLAGDFIARSFARTGRIAPGGTLDSPLRRGVDAPVFGLCWRGGSGQNRREERHIPLGHLLDLLPPDMRILALQFDITEAERARLQADPRAAVPLADLTRNPTEVIDMIRPLAGVISVDSANWHMAGFSGVPLLAILNPTAHWYWGPQEDAASVFPSATTLRKADLSAPAIARWAETAEARWQARPLAARPEMPPHQRPLFVCGLPRSGTSLVMRVLVSQGLWTGETIAGNADNPEGYQENRRIRERHLKPFLQAIGADPRGVDPLPRPDTLPPFPGLTRRLLSSLREEGHAGQPWGYKDPKLTLLWPAFARAFPGARWLVVRRGRTAVKTSLSRAGFMQMHSSSPDYWDAFCAAYERRLDALEASGETVFSLQAEALMAGDVSGLAPVCTALGLPFDAQAARAALRR
ncbi:sulfotransferase [Pseudooceanicola sp. CBS1P-1]|uniref:Sulfotransferase n=1 Tax=Pseudooceanicola albus TaxID=2692189 RepID=A0A6L7G812_9RHOB|nr:MULTISPECIES: sulfotransferase [Pseudooceanicola]MBT9382911.1 sulfotransferase [Pseudooceanicola endophyticus]MXN20165.1 sulfotransferase [Pseudooceanicola albus]